MSPPTYTQKTRAKRIALDYFKRTHPFRRWMGILSIAAPLLAAIWFVAYAARGDQHIYRSGPVSSAHTLFGTRCTECHAPAPANSIAATAGTSPAPDVHAAGGFFQKVSDQACSKCHAG